MPPTIRRSWHDCWKKGATKSCLGVDYICFARPASLSESTVSASRVVLPMRTIVLSGSEQQSTKSTNLLCFIMRRPQLGQLSWPHNPEPPRSPGKRDQYV